MNQRAVTDAISQLQIKGDVYTRQLIIEQRRIDDIGTVSGNITTAVNADSKHSVAPFVSRRDAAHHVLRFCRKGTARESGLNLQL